MKDPAALLFIDKWITATRGMRGAEKGWYLDLILYQYDKGPLPNDFDELASICSVRPSEYKLFEQVFEQVLKQKFKENESGRLENEFAKEIIQKRQQFKDKRSNSGKLSYVIRYATKNFKLNKAKIEFIKENADLSIDLKNEQVLKQMLEQILELYINVDVNVNEDKNLHKDELVYPFDTSNFKSQWYLWKEYKKKEHKFTYKTIESEQAALKSIGELSRGSEEIAIKIIHQSIANSWKGLFEIKNNNGRTTKEQQSKRTDFIKSIDPNYKNR